MNICFFIHTNSMIGCYAHCMNYLVWFYRIPQPVRKLCRNKNYTVLRPTYTYYCRQDKVCSLRGIDKQLKKACLIKFTKLMCSGSTSSITRRPTVDLYLIMPLTIKMYVTHAYVCMLIYACNIDTPPYIISFVVYVHTMR